MRGWLVAMTMLCSVAAAATEPPAGYVVRQSLGLQPAAHGFNGSLQLIHDARLGDGQRSPVWGGAADGSMIGQPLRGARLRLLDAAGRLVDELAVEPPVATFEAAELQGPGRPVYLLRADYGHGIGALYGLVTFPLEIQAGRLRRLMAIDEAGIDRPGEDERDPGRAEPIVLMSALRSGWVLLGDGPAKAILAARSRPHLEDPLVRDGLSGDSVVLYHTYRFRDGQWHRRERRMLGEWEDGGEDSWPDRRLFP